MNSTLVNTFGIDIIPDNDEKRVEALRRYQILDTPSEEAFTNLAHIIADSFNVPIALVSLVDKERVQFKGNVGMPGVKNVDRGKSLCSLAVLSSEPTVVEKPLEDPCLLANPLIHGDFGLRFYAGAPLVTHDGYHIGTVCIIDKKERSFSERERERLVRFAKAVMHEIELRLAAKKQREAEAELSKAQTQLHAALKIGKVTPWHWDIIQDKVYGGPELANLFNINSDEINNGLPLYKFTESIHKDDLDYVMNRVQQAIESGEEYEAEYRTINNDNIRWVIARGQVQYDRKKVAIGFSGILIDITEKKEAENILQYRTAVLEAQNEATSEGVLIVDPNGKMLSYNSRFLQMWGIPGEIIDSKDDTKALQYAMTLLKDPEAFLQRVNYLYKHPGEKSTDEIHFKDGRVFDRYGSAVFGKDGTYYGWAWYFKDITDRKRAEEEVKVKNAQLHDLYQELQFVTDTIPQLAWATNPDGEAYFFNKGWFEYTGLNYEDLKDHGWAQALHPEDFERVNKYWTKARTTGDVYEVEYRLRRYDGEYRWFLARGTPMRDENGNIMKWYGTTTDIHDKKMAEEILESRVLERTRELTEANNHLKRVNSELEQFTYVSHHDLQEPLRKIMMFTDMVKSDSHDRLTEPSQMRLEKIADATRRMSTALKDVLNFASLSKEEQFSKVDLDEVLAAVVLDLELVITEKKAKVSISSLPTINAVPQQMHQLFYNLVNNALKFAKPDVSPMVFVECKELDNRKKAEHADLDPARSYYEITVKDNGIGFNQASADKIFQMFQRLHNRADYPGTGIGLAMVKKIVLNHNGKIWAESQLGEGATFYILLPAE